VSGYVLVVYDTLNGVPATFGVGHCDVRYCEFHSTMIQPLFIFTKQNTKKGKKRPKTL
jgi:hypothetical protein